jgi:hypothetical protein
MKQPDSTDLTIPKQPEGQRKPSQCGTATTNNGSGVVEGGIAMTPPQQRHQISQL